MKIGSPFLSAILLCLNLLAQDDISGIFDDLADLESSPATQQSTAPAANQQPTSATLQPPQTNPVLYPSPSAQTSEKSKDDLPPLDAEKTITRGRDAYSAGNLNEAKTYFEAVLYDDPLNATAIRWLKRIAAKTAAREKQSYTATRTRILKDVQAAWNTPKAEGTPARETERIDQPTETELKQQALRAKLESIRIPAITFQNADIQQVVLELSAICRKLDGDGKGVNLVVFGTAETLLPPITFSGTDMSAFEALNIITQMSGMKYDIGPNMISLTPVNYEPPQQMVSTEFDVMPAVGEKMTLMAGGTAGPSGLFDVHDFFSTIPFPQGASAQFNPEFNILLVHNATKHLPAIESLLDRYNKKALEERSRQVEIETKFIEVAEGALDELGFEWTFGAGQDYVNDDTWAVKGDDHLFTDTLRTGIEAFDSSVGIAGRATSFNSLANTVSDPTGAGLINEVGTVTIEKIKGDKINLVISALERQSGSDLLSAPKVLAKSGETAEIHVGEIHRFPTAYDVIIERYAQPSLLPLDYEEYKTGVMLEVTPDVSSENKTIELKLSPEIRELAGFDEQHAATIWPDFGDEQLNIGTTEATSEGSNPALFTFLTEREKNRNTGADRLIARMPVFRSRKVETSVTIEDGSTIAMGGLIKEKMETFKDSVPILGKIPLLGRLFRSEGEKSVKRNLLIFVTANQVDSAGYRTSVN